jgi:sialate O-acetylesterase
MKRLLPVLPFLLLAPTALAAVKLPAIFSDHMVLQSGVKAPVWGWADAGEKVTVSIAGQHASATAGADGKWMVRLNPLPESPTATMFTVKGTNEIVVNDVLVGDVWLCSGQSNMGWRVGQSNNPDEEAKNASHPTLRMFTVGSSVALEPQADCKGEWKVCTPETVKEFSATAYFFGRDLQSARKMPLGLINSSVGGTPVESWTSLEVQQGKPELAELFAQWAKEIAEHEDPASDAKRKEIEVKWKDAVAKAKAEKKTAPRKPDGPGRPRLHNHHPGNLFNGKIAPLIPYALKGAIWYQGESNANPAERAALYEFMFNLMVKDWRTRWGQGDFAFAWVQLPNFMARKPESVPTGENWPVLRNAQTRSLALPNTGMTVNLDIGEANDIHPKNKQDIGKRLSLWARAKVYGENIPWHGPVHDSVRFDGDRAVVNFRANGGLKTTDGTAPKSFAIAGADLVWKPAEAKVEGNTVVLTHPELKAITTVRYAWANNPEVNLTDDTGLPTAPFRTDSAPLYTPVRAP